MTDEINYKNNPLHGLSLKNLLIELVDHYGFEILHAYLNLNCFNKKADIASSVKFLKKTDWAREKVEVFYLYQFKNLPRCSSEQFALPARDRIVPEGDVPGEPAVLSLEDAERLREKQARKAAEYGGRGDRGRSESKGKTSSKGKPSSKGKAPSKSQSPSSSLSKSKPTSDIWAKAMSKKFD